MNIYFLMQQKHILHVSALLLSILDPLTSNEIPRVTVKNFVVTPPLKISPTVSPTPFPPPTYYDFVNPSIKSYAGPFYYKGDQDGRFDHSLLNSMVNLAPNQFIKASANEILSKISLLPLLAQPSAISTVRPSLSPSIHQTFHSTLRPNPTPTTISKPSPLLTLCPTSTPTASFVPSKSPSFKPSRSPSMAPTFPQSSSPTIIFPTLIPTNAPTLIPSISVTLIPSKSQPTSSRPSVSRTTTPSIVSVKPSTSVPTALFTSIQNSKITNKPSTTTPSLKTSISPSVKPTSSHPVRSPSRSPSVQPSHPPVPVPSTKSPSSKPSNIALPLTISYHSGPVMVSSKLYNIYFGMFPQSTMDLLDYFAANVGSSSWFGVLKTFYSEIPGQGDVKQFVKNVTFANRTTYLPAARGLSITVADIASAILSSANNKLSSLDPNGIYTVMFRGDFNFSLWNTRWCSAHFLLDVSGVSFPLKVSVVGDPGTAADPTSTCMHGSPYPNGDAGADSMVTYYAHELANIITNPLATGWYLDGPNLTEAAGICNWNFGSISSDNSNLLIGPQKKPFLLEELYEPGVGCTLTPGSNSDSNGQGNSGNSQGSGSGVVPPINPTAMPVTLPTISPAMSFDLDYHAAGQVMTYPVGFVNIFLGEFSDTTVGLINYFASNIGSTAWFNVLTSYYQIDSVGLVDSVINTTYFTGNASYSPPGGPRGRVLHREDIEDIIYQMIYNGSVYLDSNSVYAVNFNGNFNISYDGKYWLRDWCSLHGAFRLPSLDVIKYTLIGDPSTVPGQGGLACTPLSNRLTANGDPGGDSMVVAYAEQVVNTVTDGLLDAWYSDVNGLEAGSACRGNFGSVDLSNANTGNFNINVTGKQFLVQGIWQPGKGCTFELI